MRKCFLYIALLAAVSACIYPYDLDLETNPAETLVADGEIVVGGVGTLNLSFLSPLSGGTVYDQAYGGGARQPYANAWVEDSEGTQYRPSSAAAGNRFYFDLSEAPAGRQYRTVIELDGETYESAWLTPLAPPEIKDVRFEADETNVFTLVTLDAGPEGTGYIGLTYEETWEFHAEFYPSYGYMPETHSYLNYEESQFEYRYYWCWRSRSSNGMVLVRHDNLSGNGANSYPMFAFPRTDSRNHKKYSILVQARTLSEETYKYNNWLEELDRNGSSLFEPDPGQMQGNLACTTDPSRKVMGLVTASQVTSKRAFLYSQFLRPVRPDESQLKIIPDGDEELMDAFYYNWNYLPVYYLTQGDQYGMGWGPRRCVDCRAAGGNQSEPPFWNEDL